MSLTVGINHVTVVTRDLDRLVTFYRDMFDAEKVFEGAATEVHPRMAIVEIGGTRYVKLVESHSGAATAGPAVERFGLAVGSLRELRELRSRMVDAGARIGEVERLPIQWVMRVADPDGAVFQVYAQVTGSAD